MPELSRFYGLIIKMMYMDDGQHNKPHIHVYYGEYEASIGIDGELLAGSLPVKQMKLVEAWLVLHEDEAYAAWNNAVAGKSFSKMESLMQGVLLRASRLFLRRSSMSSRCW